MLHLIALALTASTLTTPFIPHRAPGIISGLSAPEIEYLLTAPERRVRALTPHLEKALSDGLRRSPTFAALVRALEESDVIVQVVRTPFLPDATQARTLIVPGHRAFRFLRIEIGTHLSGNDLVALVGHELFHAGEIASATHVRDEPELARHYRRIGFRVGRGDQFETSGARSTERRIRGELGSDRTRHVARGT